MLPRWALVLLFLITAAVSLPGQQPAPATVDVGREPQPIASLDNGWRFHPGDDPSWAAPNFDDSNWPLIVPNRNWEEQGYRDYTGFAWYRIRLKMPVTSEALALSLGPIDCEVYADGKLISTLGIVGQRVHDRAVDPVNVIELPAALQGRTITLAVRAWSYISGASLAARSSFPTIAPLSVQQLRRDAALSARLIQEGPDHITELLAACLGFFSLGLYLLQRRSREYGWAALAYTSMALLNLAMAYGIHHHGDITAYSCFRDFFISVHLIAYTMFVWGFIAAPRKGLFRAALGLLALAAVTMQMGAFRVWPLILGGAKRGLVVGESITFTLFQVWVICVFVCMIFSARRGNRNAQLLIIPMVLNSTIYLLVYITSWLAVGGVMRHQWSFVAWQSSYMTIGWADIFAWLAMASLVLILILRFARTAESEQRLSSEMETARRVQAQLVPVQLPSLPHFAFDVAYRAASEVGGDFYQVFPRSDGSALILLGDVSGKGLKAAMLGTLIVGAAGALAQEDLRPGEMLARLNRHLCGRTDGGFATCVCALLTPAGVLTVANAGQLSPYHNGCETASEAGLPLGIVPQAEYAETTLQLAPGDTLTFLSDGVVEARAPGGELFGFERTREISARPAEEIAAAAQQFGQEDDITVLRIALAAVPAAA